MDHESEFDPFKKECSVHSDGHSLHEPDHSHEDHDHSEEVNEATKSPSQKEFERVPQTPPVLRRAGKTVKYRKRMDNLKNKMVE